MPSVRGSRHSATTKRWQPRPQQTLQSLVVCRARSYPLLCPGPDDCNMHGAADAHALTTIERDGGRVIGEDMQKRDFAARNDLVRDRRHQNLSIAAAAKIRMHAYAGHFHVIAG